MYVDSGIDTHARARGEVTSSFLGKRQASSDKVTRNFLGRQQCSELPPRRRFQPAPPRRAKADPPATPCLSASEGVTGRQVTGRQDPANFRGLFLGCIEAKFCK